MVEPNFPHLNDDHDMPDRVRKAFETHYEVELEPSGLVEQTIREIERVYSDDEKAVVSVSGGKDSMVLLALADRSDAAHRALHWDYGPDLIPRKDQKEVVENILKYTSRDRLLVANEMMHRFAPYSSDFAGRFRTQLHKSERLASQPSIRETQDGKPIQRIISRIKTTKKRDDMGVQVVALLCEESASRDRKINGLYGTSLGFASAYPLRNWTARDVWSYIVAEGVEYPCHYDRVTGATGNDVEAYEDARMSVWHRDEPGTVAPEGIHGVAEWDSRGIRSDR